MEALHAILTRRSTQNYTSKPVEQDKLEKIIAAGRQAPSGGNNQTSHFLVIRKSGCAEPAGFDDGESLFRHGDHREYLREHEAFHLRSEKGRIYILL